MRFVVLLPLWLVALVLPIVIAVRSAGWLTRLALRLLTRTARHVKQMVHS